MLFVPRESSASTALAARPSVAVVHNRPLYLAVLAELLSTPPTRAATRTFERSDAAVEAVLAGDFQLVVCGLRAQPLTGIQLVTAIREAAGPPVALIAEPEDSDTALKAFEIGANGVLTSDISQNEFIAGIQAILSGHSVLSDRLARRSLAGSTGRDHRAPAIAAYRQLSSTEREILMQLGQATSIDSIATARGISKKTVRNHVASIYRKLALRSRSEAILWVARMGLSDDGGDRYGVGDTASA